MKNNVKIGDYYVYISLYTNGYSSHLAIKQKRKWWQFDKTIYHGSTFFPSTRNKTLKEASVIFNDLTGKDLLALLDAKLDKLNDFWDYVEVS